MKPQISPPLLLVSMLIHLPVPVKLGRARVWRLSRVETRLRKIDVASLAELDTLIGELEALATCIESRTKTELSDES